MDSDILHPPISLLSSLTNSPVHAFLPTKPGYTNSVFSLELHSQHLHIYSPSLPWPFQVQPRVPVFKIDQHDVAFWTGLHTSTPSSEPFSTHSQCALVKCITHHAPWHDSYKWLPIAQGQRLKSLYGLQGLHALAPPFSSVLSFFPFPFQLWAPIALGSWVSSKAPARKGLSHAALSAWVKIGDIWNVRPIICGGQIIRLDWFWQVT